MKEHITVVEQRHLNQISLDTFTHGRENILDFPVDKLIKDLKAEIEKAYSEHNEWIELEQNNPNRFQELEEQLNLTGDSLHNQMYNYIQNAVYLEEELFALFEMKIIYSFKHLEINIKQLLFAAYQDDYINRQFKWEAILQFLNSKDIDAKELDEFESVNQLRSLNNSLKHTDKTVDQSIKYIPEFKNKEVMNYSDLEEFYNRVKNSPKIFLTSLISIVYQDLYAFNNDRVSELATSLALRMDKEVAIELCDKLMKHYK